MIYLKISVTVFFILALIVTLFAAEDGTVSLKEAVGFWAILSTVVSFALCAMTFVWSL